MTIETTQATKALHVEVVRKANYVWWSRDGEKRLVPNGVIANAIATWDAGKTLLAAGLIEEVPRSWGEIPWEACKPLPSPSKVNVTSKPRLPLPKK